ncbi:MAG: hypothetical protein QM736_08275 [Vicinamibacterales bacterium]
MVRMTGTNLNGQVLELATMGPHGEYFTIVRAPYSAGIHTIPVKSFIEQIPDGEYTSFHAAWAGLTANYVHNYQVWHNVRHTTYNTPTEVLCPDGSGPALNFLSMAPNDRDCFYNSITLRPAFIEQTHLNGHGRSISESVPHVAVVLSCKRPTDPKLLHDRPSRGRRRRQSARE